MLKGVEAFPARSSGCWHVCVWKRTLALVGTPEFVLKHIEFAPRHLLHSQREFVLGEDICPLARRCGIGLSGPFDSGDRAVASSGELREAAQHGRGRYLSPNQLCLTTREHTFQVLDARTPALSAKLRLHLPG